MSTSYYVFEIIGYIGGWLLATALFHQLYKVYKKKSASTSSYWWKIQHLVGISCIVSYGLYLDEKPIYIPASVQVLLVFVAIYQKYYYNNIYKPKTQQNSPIKVEVH